MQIPMAIAPLVSAGKILLGKHLSQHDEDLILEDIIQKIGVGPRKFVEFGFGPSENNTLSFAVHHRASGLYIDGSKRTCLTAQRTFSLIGRSDIRVLNAWITKENIDSLIGSGDIDVLSIDVDGNDYWLWREIHSVRPRIVIVEYNASFGPERAVTVPYDPAFERHQKHSSGIYHGMSLGAAVNLGNSKGLALVACDSEGLNAFFVQRTFLKPELPEVSVEQAYRPHGYRLSRGISQAEQEAIVYSLPVVEV